MVLSELGAHAEYAAIFPVVYYIKMKVSVFKSYNGRTKFDSSLYTKDDDKSYGIFSH